MKYSLKFTLLLVGLCGVIAAATFFRVEWGFGTGDEALNEATKVMTFTGGGAGAIRSDKTTDELLDERLASLDVTK